MIERGLRDVPEPALRYREYSCYLSNLYWDTQYPAVQIQLRSGFGKYRWGGVPGHLGARDRVLLSELDH